MIISHKHRYLFVEIPHTGSTAISHELRANYEGENILKKHSFYSEFLKIATPEEKNYFVFAGIRNPLDEAVTRYYKNHKLKTNDGEGGMDYQTFFMKYYKFPYNNFSCMISGHYDCLIRFESLQEDFARVLQILGLEPKRPLPIRNSTKGRKKDFWSYYTPDTIPRAKRVFGPFMKQWGYEFPPEWGDYSLTMRNQLEFALVNLSRNFKWKQIRFIEKCIGINISLIR